MRRREFIAGLGSAAAWPFAAHAQQPAMPVIGWLNVGLRNESVLSAFRKGLRETGFIEGQNVAIESRWAENQNDRMPALAADLVQRRVAVIAAAPNPSGIEPAKAATSIIPIVFLSGPDPVRTGLVASLNRPGGNLTGVTLFGDDLTAKRFDLLHHMAPQIAAIALLEAGARSDADFVLKEAESAGQATGVRIVRASTRNEGGFEAAFATAASEGADALLVLPSMFFIDHRNELVALAAKYRLPAIYQTREFVAAGG
jgi:putative tryptophan/tyrosine transport system substrate-binding protein